MLSDSDKLSQFPPFSSGKTVVIGMSGGVDSAVSALILKQKEYNVIGLTLLLHSKANEGKKCCGIEDISDAKKICNSIGIKHYVINESELFHLNVINYTSKNFMNDKMIVPCDICNSKVRIPSLINFASLINADYVATGHYAMILHSRSRSILNKPKDLYKDQTHFLSNIDEEHIRRFITPVGNLKKKEVRQIAKENNIFVYDKNDSQDLCFLKQNESIYDFVKKSQDVQKISGEFVYNSEVIGHFDDFYKYSVGQRKGLGISYRYPLYIYKKDLENKIIYLAADKEMYSRSIELKNVKIKKYFELKDKVFRCQIVTRALKGFVESKVTLLSNKEALIESTQSDGFRYVTSGQTCVMYFDEIVIGSGIII